jgi:hypothetical protein
MLFRETTAVHFENHMKHINTLWAKCRVKNVAQREPLGFEEVFKHHAINTYGGVEVNSSTILKLSDR